MQGRIVFATGNAGKIMPQRKGGNYGRARKSAIHRTLRAAQSGGRAGRRVQQHSAPRVTM